MIHRMEQRLAKIMSLEPLTVLEPKEVFKKKTMKVPPKLEQLKHQNRRLGYIYELQNYL